MRRLCGQVAVTTGKLPTGVWPTGQKLMAGIRSGSPNLTALGAMAVLGQESKGPERLESRTGGADKKG